MSTKLYFGGIPTKVDVDKLIEEFKNYKEGDLIPYESIEETISEKRKSFRWASVVTAWRKRLYRENNMLLIAEANKGFLIANPEERITHCAGMVNQGKRKIFRGASIASATEANRLSEDGQKKRDHLRMLPARLKLAEQVAPKTVE